MVSKIMRFLEFIHKIDEDALTEAAKDRYIQMFQNLPQFIKKYKELELENIDQWNAERIKWAMKTFPKSNGRTWWLRWYKLFVLKQIANTPVEPEDQEASDAAKALYTKEVRRIGAKSGLGDGVTGYIDNIVNPQQMGQFEHFMSLPVDEIQNFPFEWQTPYDVINAFGRAEGEWQKALAGNVPQREEHRPVVKFPDGSAWMDLGVAGCEEEGTAMGHCGNAPTQRSGQTVLSYRTPSTDKKGNPAWKPHLTFILDTNTGMIGEMKGRNNNKPDQKYHEVIMELLRQPFIEGIQGGGYKPENNFRLSDLNEEQFDEMISMKPALADPYDQFLWNDREVTPELVTKLDNLLSDDLNIGFGGYDEEKDKFILANELGSAGDIFSDYSQESSELYIDDDDMGKLLKKYFDENMSEQEISYLARYFNSKYPDEEQITAMTDADIVYEALESEDDVVIDELREVAEDYLKEMVEGEMEQQIDSADEYNYDERSSGLFFDKDDNGSYRLVADPEQFLENDLPRVMDGETTEWMHLAPTDYFRDPNDDWQQALRDDDDEHHWKYFSDHITNGIKNKPGYQEAMKLGTHPGAEAEQKSGQLRMFDSKGNRR